MHLAEKADDNNTQESFNTGEIVLMGLYVNYSSPGPLLCAINCRQILQPCSCSAAVNDQLRHVTQNLYTSNHTAKVLRCNQISLWPPASVAFLMLYWQRYMSDKHHT